MKLSEKIIRLIPLIILFAVTLLCIIKADYATDVCAESENHYSWDEWIYYNRKDHVCVCGYTGTERKITVPREINGKPVTEISARAKEKFTEDELNYVFFEDNNESTVEVVVPEGVISIDKFAFAYSKIEKIELPKSLISIGRGVFNNCEELTSVTIPQNVKKIEGFAFSSSGITEIYLPEGLKIIGEYAFESTPLAQIYIPNTVTYIGEYAFSQSKLEEITLPQNLTKLESGLFYNCVDLKKACISEGTLWLGHDIFNACSNLEEVYFPSTLHETVTVFQGNESLKNIYFAADEEECRSLLGNNIMDSLTGKSSGYIEEPAEYYDNVTITYNTPVPLAKPARYPKLKLDNTSIILISAAAICLIMTVIFLVLFIREKNRTAVIKAEERKKEEEGFHPDVLGTWECKKCGTINSPIGSYCYKCGRKR